ncbi:MAG: PAS domain S-box protein [Verrucomicrobia bacterium]|nr:PAS domain S-box protein [Verrucomicrobiota bacterium]
MSTSEEAAPETAVQLRGVAGIRAASAKDSFCRGYAVFCVIAVLLFACFGAFGGAGRTAVVPLTTDEQAWLRAHEPLRYAPDPAFAPFEFIGPDGQVGGITPDLLNLIAQRLGTEIKPVRYKTWSEVLAGMQRGEADLLGTLTRTPEREEFLDFTQPYLEVPLVLFVNKASAQFKGIKDFKGRRVGVVQDYGAHSWLRQAHPELIVEPVSNTREGLMKVVLGQLDAMLEVLPVGQHVITEVSLTELRVLPEIVLTLPQHLAVAKGNTQLLAILNRGLGTLTEAERRGAFRKWTGEEELAPSWRIPPVLVRVGLGLGLAGLLLVSWSITLRRRVAQQERKIRENLEREAALERRYREVVENASDLVYTHDFDGKFIFFNPAAERFLGYTREESLKLNIADVVAPEHLDKVRQRVAEKLQNDVPTTYEVEVVTKDRRRLWIEVNTRLLHENGKPIGVQGIGRDITDRKRMEQELRRSELLYHSLVESLPLCVFRKDSAGRFTFVNQRFCEFVGVRQEEVVGKTDFDLFPADAAEQYRADDLRVMETGHAYDAEERTVARKGENRWVRVIKTSLKDVTGKTVGIQGVFWDVTERREARESLKESLSLLQATLDSTWDGILVVDQEGRITSYNHRFMEMWQIPEEVMTQRNSCVLVELAMSQLKDPEGFKAKVDAIDQDPEARCEDIIEFKDGRVFEFYTQPQKVGDKIVGRVWCFHDATARKRAESERRRVEEQLRQSQKLEAVGQLAAGVAHDFNNVLTTILGNGSLLQSDLPPGSRVHGYVKQIIASAERAAKLTKQLMLFSRKQSPRYEPVNLNEILENMARMLRTLIGEHIELNCNYASTLPLIKADPGMMEQLIVNLVVNARDAMPQGGTLTLSTFAINLDERTAAQKGLSDAGVYVCFSVLDTGIGMDAATMERIFEPFFTTKDVGKGTGLGLSTVHGIVQQHGGCIEVESAVGKGSRFTVFLPGSPSLNFAGERTSPRVMPRGQGETIFVVEDEPAVRSVVEVSLKSLGYAVITAGSGREALDIWPSHAAKINLLMTDIVMPGGINGIELAARLMKDNPSLKVIYTSGYSTEITEGRFNLPPKTRFLQKPYLVETLASVVRTCLDE